MSQQFNVDEIFEIAEQIERNGAAYYRRAADFSKLEPSKNILLRLAAMEDEHERTFASLRAQLSLPEWKSYASAPDDEVVLYLRAIAEGHVFDLENPALKLTGDETLEQILRTAIKLEEDSIIFYLGMKDLVPHELGRHKIDDIIRQERGHIIIISKELAKL